MGRKSKAESEPVEETEFFDISGQVLSRKPARISVVPKGMQTEIVLFEPMWSMNFMPMVLLGKYVSASTPWVNDKPIEKVILVGQDLLTKKPRILPPFEIDQAKGVTIEVVDGKTYNDSVKAFDKAMDFGDRAKSAGMKPLKFELPPKGDEAYGGITEAEFEAYKQRFPKDKSDRYEILSTSISSWQGKATIIKPGDCIKKRQSGDTVLDAFALSLYKNIRLFHAHYQYMKYVDSILAKSNKSLFEIASKLGSACTWDSKNMVSDDSQFNFESNWLNPFSGQYTEKEQKKLTTKAWNEWMVEAKGLDDRMVLKDVEIYTVLRPFMESSGFAERTYDNDGKAKFDKKKAVATLMSQFGTRIKLIHTTFKDVDIKDLDEPKTEHEKCKSRPCIHDKIGSVLIADDIWGRIDTIASGLLKDPVNEIENWRRELDKLKKASEFKMADTIATTKILDSMLAVVEQYDKFAGST